MQQYFWYKFDYFLCSLLYVFYMQNAKKTTSIEGKL